MNKILHLLIITFVYLLNTVNAIFDRVFAKKAAHTAGHVVKHAAEVGLDNAESGIHSINAVFKKRAGRN